MDATKQAMHDKLLAEVPGLGCIDDCVFCKETASKEESVSEDKIYSQEVLDNLLATARSEAAGDARKDADIELASVQATLKEKEEALAAAEGRVAELEAEEETRAEEARVAILADERAEQVAEVTEFSEEQLDERKANWAGMSEEAFAQVLADFEAATESASNKETGTKNKKKVESSAFTGTRETAGDEGSELGTLRTMLASGA